MEKIKFFKIEVPTEVWTDFKETINKNHTIQSILIELIKERITKFKAEKSLQTAKIGK